MSVQDNYFQIEGIEFDGGPCQTSGDSDPSTSLLDLPQGSLYLRTNGEVWWKYGSVSNQWKKIGDTELHQIQEQVGIWCGTAGGTNNALELTPNPAITSYVAGQTFTAKIGPTSSDDAVTLSVSGLAAKAVQINGVACSATVRLEAGKLYRFDYDGTQFQATRLSIGANVAYTDTVQTFNGVQTFSDSPIVPTAPVQDSSNKAASTEFVRLVIEEYFSTNNSGGSNGENDIGIPGQVGFGVGVCPIVPNGFSELPGTRILDSSEYGNYQYSDGSIMVWIPAFYYKYGTGTNGLSVNEVSIKAKKEFESVEAANAAGYVLHRAFYDGGEIKDGVFVDKYQCSNNNGIASSIKFGNPLSSSSMHNPFSELNESPPNTYGGAIPASKTRGNNFFPSSRFIYAALALLSLAHAQNSMSGIYCAWYSSGGKNYPKGNNNNALGDIEDTSVSYESDGYGNCGKTGSGNPFAKTTHNGQECGVADLNGNMWEVSLGLTSKAKTLNITGATQSNPCVLTVIGHDIPDDSPVYIVGVNGMTQLNWRVFIATVIDENHVSLNVDSTSFSSYTSGGLLTFGTYYSLKPSVAMKNITSGNFLSTDHWGVVGIDTQFDPISIPFVTTYPNNSISQVIGNLTNQVLSETNWVLTGLGIAKDSSGISQVGSSMFGLDAYIQGITNFSCPFSGGYWGSYTMAGIWSLYLSDIYSYSFDGVGFRSALYL